MLAVDCSNFTGWLAPEQIECLKTNGVGHVIVRASLESPDMIDIARQQLQACKDAGLSTSIYIWSYDDWSARGTIRDTVDAFASLATTKLEWIDVEPYQITNPRLPSIQWLRDAIDEVKLRGYRPGIYTGQWVWVSSGFPYRNTTEFADAGIPLWTAEFDRNPDIAIWSRYGGWTKLAAKQYVGSGQQRLCGLEVDLSIVADDIFNEPPVDDPIKDTAYLRELHQWASRDSLASELRLTSVEDRMTALGIPIPQWTPDDLR